MQSSMTSHTLGTVTHSPMAWALYLSSSNDSSVTNAQLAELDDFELISRTGPGPRAHLLQTRIGYIVHALICTAGSINSRSQMMRSVGLLQEILNDADHDLLQKAVRGLISAHVNHLTSKPQSPSSTFNSPLSPRDGNNIGPTFLRPLADIAINRVSDSQLSSAAADCLAILLGCPFLDNNSDDLIPSFIRRESDQQVRRLIAMLITEIVLTSSPRALSSLSKLLRRDATRQAFCEKDGVSTLASTLQTDPLKGYTAIGEIIARSEVGADPVYASYHAVFSVWMLTFALDPVVVELVLSHVLSSRLVVILVRLLNHASGQRLKIARVTLASLHNIACGDSELHRRIRRDLVSTEVPGTLERLMTMTAGAGSLIGKDDDAMSDARVLLDLLTTEKKSMSTLDAYIAEVQAGALHWSALRRDTAFWVGHAQEIVDDSRGVVAMLAETIRNKNTDAHEKTVACHDLALLMGHSDGGRRKALVENDLKRCLMTLMTADEDYDLRARALECVQLMLLHHR